MRYSARFIRSLKIQTKPFYDPDDYCMCACSVPQFCTNVQACQLCSWLLPNVARGEISRMTKYANRIGLNRRCQTIFSRTFCRNSVLIELKMPELTELTSFLETFFGCRLSLGVSCFSARPLIHTTREAVPPSTRGTQTIGLRLFLVFCMTLLRAIRRRNLRMKSAVRVCAYTSDFSTSF
jgi:hypothetical protein